MELACCLLGEAAESGSVASARASIPGPYSLMYRRVGLGVGASPPFGLSLSKPGVESGTNV